MTTVTAIHARSCPGTHRGSWAGVPELGHVGDTHTCVCRGGGTGHDEGHGMHVDPWPLTRGGQAMQAPGPGHGSLLLPTPVSRQLGHFLLVQPLRSPDALLVQPVPDHGGSGHPQPFQNPLFDGFQLELVLIPRVGPQLHAGEKQQELEAAEGDPKIPQDPRHRAGSRRSRGDLFAKPLARRLDVQLPAMLPGE